MRSSAGSRADLASHNWPDREAESDLPNITGSPGAGGTKSGAPRLAGGRGHDPSYIHGQTVSEIYQQV